MYVRQFTPGGGIVLLHEESFTDPALPVNQWFEIEWQYVDAATNILTLGTPDTRLDAVSQSTVFAFNKADGSYPTALFDSSRGSLGIFTSEAGKNKKKEKKKKKQNKTKQKRKD